MTNLTALLDPSNHEWEGEDNDDQRVARDTIKCGHVERRDLLAAAIWSALADCLCTEGGPPNTCNRLVIIEGWEWEGDDGKFGTVVVFNPPDCDGSKRQKDRSCPKHSS